MPASTPSSDPGEPEAELVETTSGRLGRGVEDAGDGPQVVVAHRQHPTVEVLALHLDHPQVPTQHRGFGAVELVEPGEVDGDGFHLGATGAAVGEVDGTFAVEARTLVLGQELVDGHVVEP